MKTHKIFLPILFLFFISCNRISFVESSICDSLGNCSKQVDIVINNNEVLFDDINVDSLSQIRYLVSDFRDNSYSCARFGKLHIDESCDFSLITPIINEFRKCSFLNMYLKVNHLKDSCWLKFRLPPIPIKSEDHFIGNAKLMPQNKKDSLGLLIVEYYTKNSVLVNDKLMEKEILANQIDSLIESEQNYFYLIYPDSSKTFGEIFSLVDLYLTELEKMKKRYIPNGKKPIHEYNDEAQLYHFEKKYARKYSIMYSFPYLE